MDRLRVTTVRATGGMAGGVLTGELIAELIGQTARAFGLRDGLALGQQALQDLLDVPDEFRIARIRRMQTEAHERSTREHGRRRVGHAW